MHKADYAGRGGKNAVPLQDGLKMGVGMTERERIGNGIIFLEVARTRALFAGSKEDGGYKIKQR
jgi:hypothetical protein